MAITRPAYTGGQRRYEAGKVIKVDSAKALIHLPSLLWTGSCGELLRIAPDIASFRAFGEVISEVMRATDKVEMELEGGEKVLTSGPLLLEAYPYATGL